MERMNSTRTGELTTGDVAKLLDIPLSTVTRWADRGLIASYKMPSGSRRIPTGEVMRLRSGWVPVRQPASQGVSQ